MKVLSAQQMAAVDRHAIEVLGIPGPVLMENAAIGAVDALGERFPDAQHVAILAGPGNNGGDGLAMARHLDGRGYACRVILALPGDRPGGDAGLQLDILERSGIAVDRPGLDGGLEGVAAACAEADVVVDGLFGTGLSRPLEGAWAALVQILRTCGRPVLAVDLPSGLDGSRAAPIGPHAEAELTVTFAFPKIAHVLPPCADAIGELVVVDLGLPASALALAEADLELLEAQDLAGLVPPRPLGGHKGSFGHVMLVAGGPGAVGAAVLAARGAVRGGAGLVTVATPASVRDAVDLGALESMTLPLVTEGDGGLGEQAMMAVVARLDGKGAVGLGPGIGQIGATSATVRHLASAIPAPLVLDADGLNAFAGRMDLLAKRTAPTILTPHPGELARLLDTDTRNVEADRLAVVRRASAMGRAVVVLKGRRTLIAAPGAPTAVIAAGNPGMATGGSGDVLTGLITALLGQGLEARNAACLAVHLHATAGDLARDTHGEHALAAGDIVEHLGAAFATL